MTHPHSDPASTDARTLLLEARLRAHHAIALDRLSPRLRAELAQRRNAALHGHARTRAPALPRLRLIAAACATLAALAVGLHLQTAPPPAAPTTVADTPAAPPAHAPTTLLDEDPEFYAWLGANDARSLTLEPTR